MPEMPFELCDHQAVQGGVCLVFACSKCGEETTLVLTDEDPLHGNYPLQCVCGFQANMHFGSPFVGRALLRAIKRLPEAATGAAHRAPVLFLN